MVTVRSPSISLVKIAIEAVLFIIISSFIVRAGDFGEHKKIGDIAFKKYLGQNPQLAPMFQRLLGTLPLSLNNAAIPISSDDPCHFFRRSIYDSLLPIAYFEGKVVSYGDLTALSGDHSPHFISLMNSISKSASAATELFPSLFKDLAGEYKSELQDLNEGKRGHNPIFLEFIALAASDRSHFHVPATPLRQEFDQISTESVDLIRRFLFTTDSFDTAAMQMTVDQFNVNVVDKYCILHTLSKRYFSNAYTVWQTRFGKDSVERMGIARQLFVASIFCNAFSEHYLQDMFAAGHFFADRYETDIFQIESSVGLEARGVHDFFGRRGINTVINGTKLFLRGDGQYTDSQLDKAVAANIESLADAFDTNKVSKMGIDRLKKLRGTPSAAITVLFPALADVPLNPLGEPYEIQRSALGRSISGFTEGVTVSGSSNSLGLGYMAELNILFARPDTATWYEGGIGLGLRTMFDGRMRVMGNIVTRPDLRWSLGVAISVVDWLYVNGAGTLSPRDGIGGRLEAGIQIKLARWNDGLRIGYIASSGKSHDPGQIGASFVFY